MRLPDLIRGIKHPTEREKLRIAILIEFLETQYATHSIRKRTQSCRLRRPTTDKLGGLPILIDGKIIGGIGISGGRGPQDAQVAEAGLAAIK
ncbi:MAG: heme-binding protein [Bradyrhizobium sp.]